MENRQKILLFVVILVLLSVVGVIFFIISQVKNVSQSKVSNVNQKEATNSANRSIYLDLPSDFPKDFPLFPQVKVSTSQATKDQWSAVLITASSPSEVRDFYEKDLASKEWVVGSTSQAAGLTIFFLNKNQRQAILTIGKGDDGTAISITILKS